MATIKSISTLIIDGDWIESKDQSPEASDSSKQAILVLANILIKLTGRNTFLKKHWIA